MDEVVAFLAFVVLIFLMTSGIMYWIDKDAIKEDGYNEGYKCAQLFMAAESRADSLQIRLDGCWIVEVEV